MSAAKAKPARFAKATTKSDSVGIDFESKGDATRALYVGSSGDVSVEMAGDMLDPTVVFVSVLSGTILPIEITRVNSTLTTAGQFVALW